MARLEALSYSQYGKDQETQFMEAAGQAISNFILEKVDLNWGPEKRVFLLCGKGNNAGDAYVAGRYLQEQGYKVTALQVFDTVSSSPLSRSNMEKFSWVGGKVLSPQESLDFSFPRKGLIIDGLLGTGFHGEVYSPLVEIIQKANHSHLPILSVDIPSGLDASSGDLKPDAIIKARWTLALEFAKTGFFLGEAWNYVGELCMVPFGLQKEFAQDAKADFDWHHEKRIRKLLPPLKRTRHKYERGSLAILAGSKGMAGAAMLASHASLRAGTGIVRLLHPEGLQCELAQAPMELLKLAYKGTATKELLSVVNKSKAFLVGPGLSTSKSSATLLKGLLAKVECPTVLDADALNLLGSGKWKLHSPSILTPHTGEMGRLLGLDKSPRTNLEFLKRCQSFVEDKKVTLVLKGAPSFVLHPGKIPCVCTQGDPGMATAGSGDVLAGILGALLAQGLKTFEAALLGVYLHGFAGEEAAFEKSSYAMIASDIIEKIPRAYRCLLRMK